jgi:hypothetical protein
MSEIPKYPHIRINSRKMSHAPSPMRYLTDAMQTAGISLLEIAEFELEVANAHTANGRFKVFQRWLMME